METVNILFLGGAKRVSLAERLISAGKKRQLNVAIFSYELSSLVPIMQVGRVIKGKRWSDPDLIKHLEDTITNHDINVVLPFVDPAINICAILKCVLAQTTLRSVFIPVCSKAVCDTFFDKKIARDWFSNKEICHAEAVDPLQRPTFPFIAKPRKGSASSGIHVVRNEQECQRTMALITVDDYLFERYLKATEYTVDCYLDRHGKAISVVPRVRLETQGGESIRSKTVSHTGVESLSNLILAQDEFRGPITIQILEDQKTNQLFAMEVNLRFGGGVLTSIAAGADSADFLFADYLGDSLMPVTDWEPNLLMMRTFREYYISCN